MLQAGQLQAILLAYIPVRFGHYFTTNIMAVDMFIVTFISTIIIALLSLLGKVTKTFFNRLGGSGDGAMTVRVEYYRIDSYGERTLNGHWTALAWVASRSARSQLHGGFRMVVSNQGSAADDWPRLSAALDGNPHDPLMGVEDDLEDIDSFNLLPRDAAKIRFEAGGFLFDVWFDQAGKEDGDNGNETKSSSKTPEIPSEPALIVQRIARISGEPAPATVEWMSAWLLRVSRQHLAHISKARRRGRWEMRDGGGSYWFRTQDLHTSRGLDAVALDKVQGELLKRDLETFMNDRGFYAKIGMPYRRGFLFSGKPGGFFYWPWPRWSRRSLLVLSSSFELCFSFTGTGKTSLVQAISATYSKDLYYLNLKTIKDDATLQSAFSGIPRNAILIMEDVDAQSKIVHARSPDSPPRTKISERKMAMLRAAAAKEAAAKEDSDSEYDSDASSPVPKAKAVSGPLSKRTSGFADLFGPTLACLLGCLDGYAMNEGVMVILTSNHPERLDPALIRPGRIDLHLELGYCTHFQLKSMFRSIVGVDEEPAKKPETDPIDEDDSASETTERAATPSPASPIELDLTGIPERVLPPCDAMRLMVLHRSKPWEIAGKLRTRCADLLEGKGVGEAMSFEEDSGDGSEMDDGTEGKEDEETKSW